MPALLPRDQVQLMRDPTKWVHRIVLALAHARQRDRFGMPRLGFLALGHGTRLYFGNISDVRDLMVARIKESLRSSNPTANRERFEKVLERFESVQFVSYEAIYADGWRVD
jgi:hypothetical protein